MLLIVLNLYFYKVKTLFVLTTHSPNIITLTPPIKEWTMLDWVTSNRQLFVDANFLIGKKTFMTNKTTITETYFYLSKQPL